MLAAVVVMAATVASVGSIPATDVRAAGADATEDVSTGIAEVRVITDPPGAEGTFDTSGVPGTYSSEPRRADPLGHGESFAEPDLTPGTYTTTLHDPAPGFDVVDVSCDDGDSATPSAGDAGSRTAVINLDRGEHVTCTFTVAQRGIAEVRVITDPPGAEGTFDTSGVPGTYSSEPRRADPLGHGESFAEPDLTPGTYTTTLHDPAPGFDVVDVSCDDGDSATPSAGDAGSRTAVINLDRGEHVTCTFTVAQRGIAEVRVITDPPGAEGTFDTSGVPGTYSSEPRRADPLGHGESFAEPDLTPGTYTTTLHDPAPGFDVVDVSCDDGDSATPSAGDAGSRTAVINLDRGEHVTCTFTVAQRGTPPEPGPNASGRGVLVPIEGRWRAESGKGSISCRDFSRDIPPSPSEFGRITVRRGGDRLVMRRILGDGSNTIRVDRKEAASTRFVGTRRLRLEGIRARFDFTFDVLGPERIEGRMVAETRVRGQRCEIRRSVVLTYAP